MTAKLVPFTLDHIEKFDCRDLTWSTIYAEGMLAMPMVTLFIKDTIVSIFGLREVHKGVAEGFLYGGKSIKDHKAEFHKITKRLPDFAMNKYNLHRLEVIVEEKNKRWAESLGLELESVLRKFTEDKQDAYMFTRVL